MNMPGLGLALAALVESELDTGSEAGNPVPSEPTVPRSAAVQCAGCMGPVANASTLPFSSAGTTQKGSSGCVDALLRDFMAFLKRPCISGAGTAGDVRPRFRLQLELSQALFRICWPFVRLTKRLRTTGLAPMLICAASTTAYEPACTLARAHSDDAQCLTSACAQQPPLITACN